MPFCPTCIYEGKEATVRQKFLILASVLVLAVGLMVMLYPAVSSLINAKSQSQVIDRYEEEVEDFTDERIESLREQAIQYNEKLKNSSVIMTDPFDEDAVKITSEDYEKTLNVDNTGLMAFLDISEIGVHLPIYHGTGESVLARAVGHLQGTSVPIGGEDTHSVLSAHTGLAEAKLFTDLDELIVGDTFRITVLDEVLTYEIYDIEIVEPADISSLKIEDGRDLCTLVTCTPYGVNSHRLLVHGERIPTPEAEEPEERDPLQAVMFSWEYLMIGGVLVLGALVLLIVLIRRRQKRKKRIKELWRRIRGE